MIWMIIKNLHNVNKIISNNWKHYKNYHTTVKQHKIVLN